MAESGGRDLLRDWRQQMESLVSSVAGRAEVPRQLLEPLQHQLELVQELVEHQQRLQRDLAGRVAAPVDAVFDLLEQSGSTFRQQSQALEEAARALEQTAVLMKTQAELFEKTIRTLREPSRMIGSAAGVERHGRRS